VDVDAVEHGARDAFLVAGYGLVGAGAGAFGVRKVSARAGIHTTGMFFEGKYEIIVPVIYIPWTTTPCISFQVWA